MATEQLVELFAVDDVLPETSLDARFSKKSHGGDTPSTSDKHFTTSYIGENLNIEELWELSQVFFLEREIIFLIFISNLLIFN